MIIDQYQFIIIFISCAVLVSTLAIKILFTTKKKIFSSFFTRMFLPTTFFFYMQLISRSVTRRGKLLSFLLKKLTPEKQCCTKVEGDQSSDKVFLIQKAMYLNKHTCLQLFYAIYERKTMTFPRFLRKISSEFKGT